ncbi:MAG: nitronate monooxygenase family protein [Elusimicrobia bacterium]|nr:nitronate monooxygenase family protein [Candidatus Liberimonas magnetica]
MKLPVLRIGDIEVKIPIIQGGMGVRISKARLASAVTNAAGLGTVSSVGIGPVEGQNKADYAPLNAKALEENIKLAKKLAHGGPIAVNLLVAQTDYALLVKACIEAGADMLVSGAGLPFMLPEYAKGTNTKLVPIISSARAGRIIAEKWFKRYAKLPDAFIVEGILAGGHLGFSHEDLEHMEDHPLEKIVEEVLVLTKELETKYGKKIPVIAAGGIYTGEDIAKFIKMGAAGVQMATRFVCTEECDASEKFKQAYLDAKKEDITIIKSPVGMPGRAIKNDFIRNFMDKNNKVQFSCPYHCLITCNPSTAPYCIAKALLNAYAGNLDEGFAFCGENVYRCNKIVKVNDLMNELVSEAEAAL